MKLVISPHVDDEVLGCGGLLAKEGSNFFVYYVGIEEFHIVSKAERLEEIKNVANFLGFKWEYNPNTKVNDYKTVDLIDIFQDLINKLKPEMVFLPMTPSFNQDHRTVFEAAFTALRPHDRNFFVKKVLVYEQADSFIWNKEAFNPNYFVEIDINKKITAYKLHKSQVRGHRSPELIIAMAKARGSQINVPYAEGFKILRWVE